MIPNGLDRITGRATVSTEYLRASIEHDEAPKGWSDRVAAELANSYLDLSQDRVLPVKLERGNIQADLYRKQPR